MRTKNSGIILYGLVAVLLFASAAYASAEPNAPCSEGQRPAKCAWMQDKLDLTEEQAEQIKQLMTAHWEKMKDTHLLIREKKEALEEAAQSGAGEEAIRAAAAELGTALGDAAVLRAAHIEEVKEILTAEQLEKWQELKEEHKECRHKKGGPGVWRRGKGEGCEAEGKPECPMAPEGKPGCPMQGEGPRGHWGPHGRKGRMGPPDPEKIFEMKDADGDGKLTLEEFTSTKRPTPAECFEKADADGDGFLTPEELEESTK